MTPKIQYFDDSTMEENIVGKCENAFFNKSLKYILATVVETRGCPI